MIMNLPSTLERLASILDDDEFDCNTPSNREELLDLVRLAQEERRVIQMANQAWMKRALAGRKLNLVPAPGRKP